MPSSRRRAAFEPISPDFDAGALVEETENFYFVDRIDVDMIEKNGMEQFEKLVTLHVIIGGKPLVVEGFQDILDPWTFTPRWLQDNHGDKSKLELRHRKVGTDSPQSRTRATLLSRTIFL